MKIFGEAIQDKESGKWGIKINSDDGEYSVEPDYIFDSQQAAEEAIVKSLQGLSGLAK